MHSAQPEVASAPHDFQSILENSPVGIAFLDGERRFRLVNSALLELFPYREDQLLGATPWFLYATGAEYHRIEAEAYPILCQGGTYETTTQLCRANGHPFPASLRGRAVNPADLAEGFVWSVEDITEKRQREEELQVLAAAFCNGQATLITDPDGYIERTNPAFSQITGYRFEEVAGRNPRLFKSGCQGAEFYRAMWQQLLKNGHWQGEIWNRLADGKTYPLHETISVVRNPAGEIQHFVAVFHDISEQKRLEAHLNHQASHDRLTGVYNRKQMEDLLDREAWRSERYDTPFSLIMFDIDHFKRVNDLYGHHTGDDLLVQVAQQVERDLRSSDLLARWGGEEFMTFLPETSLEEARCLAERLRTDVGEAELPGLPRLTISLGLTQYRPGEPVKDLTRRLDDALYAAKDRGRNRVEAA